jgi:hypothetical protein
VAFFLDGTIARRFQFIEATNLNKSNLYMMLSIALILMVIIALISICAACTVNMLHSLQKFEEARDKKLQYRTNEEFVGRLH